MSKVFDSAPAMLQLAAETLSVCTEQMQRTICTEVLAIRRIWNKWVLMQDGSVELATSSDEEDAANPSEGSASADGHDNPARPAALRKRNRVDEPNDDPDQATSVRVRHNDHQRPAAPQAASAAASTPPAADSSRPASEAAAAAEPKEPQTRPITHVVHPAPRAPRTVQVSAPAGQAASNGSAQQGRATSCAPRPLAFQAVSGNVPAVSASSQQGDCIAPDGTFVGRAAAAGLPPNIMRQTKAALGLWEQLHETASTPSTVLAPVNRHGPAIRTVSVGTDNSAA